MSILSIIGRQYESEDGYKGAEICNYSYNDTFVNKLHNVRDQENNRLFDVSG